MYPSTVLRKLASGQTAYGTALQFVDPAVFEMTASLGFDAIWLDMEHHSLSDHQGAELIRATRAGGPTDVVIRPGKGEFMRMARLLEAGAHGVMYPRCETPAEAAEVVRWAKFAPIGERGFDGAGADGDYMSLSMPDYLQRANANTFIIIQIEDRRSLDRCEEMLATPGVDMLMLGPADLSVLSGHPGVFDHPNVTTAFQQVADAAKKTGKSWASTSFSIEHALKLAQMGAGLVFHGADIVFVRRGLTTVREALLKPNQPGESSDQATAPANGEAVTCAGGVSAAT